MRTEADDVDEVQVVTSSADAEQQLSGFWRLHYLHGRFSTQRLPWDATAAQVGRCGVQPRTRPRCSFLYTLNTRACPLVLANHELGISRFF